MTAVTKAMLLAAGYGKRMRPLTDSTPKPLLRVADKPLLQFHLERLRAADVSEVVVNLAHLGEQIESWLGDGARFGLSVRYSWEPYPLETGGALSRALEELGRGPFLLVNGDVWTDFPFAPLLRRGLAAGSLGRLVLVPNPEHKDSGDFDLDGDRVINCNAAGAGYTFSGVSLIDPQLIAGFSHRREVFPLREALQEALVAGRLEGELYGGQWWDVGTPERLQNLDQFLRGREA